jgi:hypothetical protein
MSRIDIDSGLEGVLYCPQEVGAVSRSPKGKNGPGGEKEIFFPKSQEQLDQSKFAFHNKCHNKYIRS